MTRPRVLIVGGGFGGLSAARGLATADVEVTVIDRRNHHLFQPLLYQVATAGLNPSNIARPIRGILAKQTNARVLLAEVVKVDPDTRQVSLDDGAELPYDYLILATGATHAYFGHDEWEAHAPGLKTIEDALEVRRRVLLAFERAERAADPDDSAGDLTFVVVGGGPTGVETAGAIAEIAFKTFTSQFRAIDPSHAKVILLEGADRILGNYLESLSLKGARQLRDLGVDLRLGVTVTNVDADGVETLSAALGPGTIRAGTVIWAAGNRASPLAAMIGGQTDRAGRVIVAGDLSVGGHPDVFAIGDVAHATVEGQDVPGVAQGAIQGGAQAAKAIRADLTGAPRPTFRYRNKGELATIGRSSAVGTIGPFRLSGWIAWMAWWSVHIVFLIDFRSKLSVLLNWAWNYLTFQRSARLITGPWRPRK